MVTRLLHFYSLQSDANLSFPLPSLLPPAPAFFFVEAKLCSVSHRRPGVCRKENMASKHLHADLALKAVVCCEARFRDAPRAVQTVANGGGEA